MIRPRHIMSTLWAALILTALGCAAPTLAPGPNPARLDLTVVGRVSQEAVQNAIRQRGAITTGMARFKNHYGPYWELKVNYLGADGKLYSLESPADGRLPDLLGKEVSGRTVFLLPPGTSRLRLRLCAKLRQYWDEMIEPAGPRIVNGQVVGQNQARWRNRQQELVVNCLERELEFDLGPGETKPAEIKAVFDN